MSGQSSTPSREVIIRCMCGKRYRIRNAEAGMRSRCTECDSLVEVTEADLSTDFTADGLINLHEDRVEAQDAILISDDAVRLAQKGSRPGVTGKVTHTNEEALLVAALGGRSAASFSAEARGTIASEPAPIQRTFINDLVASFWCAGHKKNAIKIIVTAMPLGVVSVITDWLPYPFKFIMFVPLFIILMWIIQFYWLVLQTTTRGEDEIPWFDTDWNLWDDVARPLLWVTWTSLVCSMPCLWVLMYAPKSPNTIALSLILLALGWFFWPVAVMSYAMGRSFAYLRPDWLVRCVYGIGPVYLIAWVLVMGTIAAWYGFYIGIGLLDNLPLWAKGLLAIVVSPLAACVNLYFGYVLFRMIGLLFRHYRTRFPWKF